MFLSRRKELIMSDLAIPVPELVEARGSAEAQNTGRARPPGPRRASDRVGRRLWDPQTRNAIHTVTGLQFLQLFSRPVLLGEDLTFSHNLGSCRTRFMCFA